MYVPTIIGLIDRRILINYTVNPDVIRKLVPKPFRPKIYNDKAIVGICLIRLKHIRPKGFPSFIGISSENGAHRIAVEWEENGELKEGVYIPRRDSSSLFNNIVGGRLFPGKHFHAKFNVIESDKNYNVSFKSSDNTTISIEAERTNVFNPNSVFHNLENASNFFQNGALGYSPNGNIFEGLLLKTYEWKVQPLNIKQVHSSFFENSKIFPKNAVEFDNALLMTNIKHEWNSVKNKNI